MTNHSSPANADLLALHEWMREPDWAENFSLEDIGDWINRRPIHITTRLSTLAQQTDSPVNAALKAARERAVVGCDEELIGLIDAALLIRAQQMTDGDGWAFAKQLSDALLRVRPLGGSELFVKRNGKYYADPDYCGQMIEELKVDRDREIRARIRLEKASSSSSPGCKP